MENRRSVARKLQNVYLHMVDKQDKPSYFQGHLVHLEPKLHGGNVRLEKTSPSQLKPRTSNSICWFSGHKLPESTDARRS